MLDSMRKPFFILALVAIFLTLMIELGSPLWVVGTPGSPLTSSNVSITGKAIPAMAMLDGLIFFATLIMGFALLIPDRAQSKVQGLVTLIFSILLLLATIALLMKDLVQLIIMVTLLMAPIFGTIAYFIIWSHFGSAKAVLSLIMTLKIGFAVLLVLAQQGFLKMKGFVLIIVTSILATMLITILYGLVPGFLVSIADVIAALIICVLAIVWAVVYLLGGLVSIFSVIKGAL
jgi:hypothetical protein